MNRTLARLLLVLITAVVLTVLCTVRFTPASGLLLTEGGRSDLLIVFVADLIIVVGIIAGGIAACFGFIFLIAYLIDEAR